jgi:pimeloyl-ACP methyl ester carboxylesterase
MAKPQFVLVHGGSHGAWCWQRLRAELAQRGYRADAPDLPGHGDDPTPRETVTWQSQVEALEQYVRQRASSQIILVGHSLAGVLLPEIARRQPEIVKQLVFLAAIVLEPGENGLDTMDRQMRETFLALARASTDQTVFFNYDNARSRFFKGLPEAEARALYDKLTPQPIDLYVQRASTGVGDLVIPIRYIAFEQDSAITPDRIEHFARIAGGSFETMDAPHGAMLTHPGALADRLIEGIA